jgi:hypothetical protein
MKSDLRFCNFASRMVSVMMMLSKPLWGYDVQLSAFKVPSRMSSPVFESIQGPALSIWRVVPGSGCALHLHFHSDHAITIAHPCIWHRFFQGRMCKKQQPAMTSMMQEPRVNTTSMTPPKLNLKSERIGNITSLSILSWQHQNWRSIAEFEWSLSLVDHVWTFS